MPLVAGFNPPNQHLPPQLDVLIKHTPYVTPTWVGLLNPQAILIHEHASKYNSIKLATLHTELLKTQHENEQ